MKPEEEKRIRAITAVGSACRRRYSELLPSMRLLLAEIDALRQAPIDMLLFCPNCGAQHIDAPDERTPDWTNPPHKSHLCHECGHVWRPCDRPTNGVAGIQTSGAKDQSPIPTHAETERLGAENRRLWSALETISRTLEQGGNHETVRPSFVELFRREKS